MKINFLALAGFGLAAFAFWYAFNKKKIDNAATKEVTKTAVDTLKDGIQGDIKVIKGLFEND